LYSIFGGVNIETNYGFWFVSAFNKVMFSHVLGNGFYSMRY